MWVRLQLSWMTIIYCLAEDNRPRAQFKPSFCQFCGPTKLCGWRSVHIGKNSGIQAIINHLFLITSNPCHFPECVAVSLVCTKLSSVRAVTPNSLCQMDRKEYLACQSLKLMIHSLQEITLWNFYQCIPIFTIGSVKADFTWMWTSTEGCWWRQHAQVCFIKCLMLLLLKLVHVTIKLIKLNIKLE